MKARFEVSTEGMRALHAGREPWQLAKELVSNAWDEAITKCDVTLVSISPRKAKLTVYDDGKGFADIKDSWTLMGDTIKRRKTTVRGRFNIGEKEILSVADAAVVHTNSTKVVFPKSGGRQVRKAMPIKGTMIVCTLPWGSRQVEDTVKALKKLLVPDDITYIVNGQEVPHLKPYKVIQGVVLETVLQDSPTEPLRSTKRKTTIELYKPDNGKATLYELGIPVQPIDCTFSVNVQQKVPLAQNRDMTKTSYLQTLYKTVLEHTVGELENVSDSWVRLGVEHKDIQPEVVKEVLTRRYGKDVVLWSANSKSNEEALENGFTVVHGRTLSAAERKAMESVGLKHSSEVFTHPVGDANYLSPDELSDGMKNVSAYAIMLAHELLDIDLKTKFYRMPHGAAAASWANNTISFNISVLGKGWFDEVNSNQTSLIIHELAHRGVKGEEYMHDVHFYKSVEALAGKAIHLALQQPLLFTKFIVIDA